MSPQTTESALASKVREQLRDAGLLDESAASDYLGGVPERTLRQWRYLGKGPAYVKVGRAPRYRREDLDAFIAGHRIDPQGAA
jgi:Helix-turn-helix domain